MKLTLQGTIKDREPTVERSRDYALLDDRILFGEVAVPVSIQARPGLEGWPGRFWLPAHSQVQPTGKSCLSRAFGRAGEPLWMVFNPTPGA